jgi:hypothetical protein
VASLLGLPAHVITGRSRMPEMRSPPSSRRVAGTWSLSSSSQTPTRRPCPGRLTGPVNSCAACDQAPPYAHPAASPTRTRGQQCRRTYSSGRWHRRRPVAARSARMCRCDESYWSPAPGRNRGCVAAAWSP